MTTLVERRIFADVTDINYGRRLHDQPRFVLDEKRVPMWIMPIVFLSLNILHFCWVNGIV
jgi:hypothetical protein